VRWPWGKDSAETLRKAEILRGLHWQCWRADAPPLETPLADLVAVLPVLIESGSVGLVWPRLWHRAEELPTPPPRELFAPLRLLRRKLFLDFSPSHGMIGTVSNSGRCWLTRSRNRKKVDWLLGSD
jgi:hypothetical protein